MGDLFIHISTQNLINKQYNLYNNLLNVLGITSQIIDTWLNANTNVNETDLFSSVIINVLQLALITQVDIRSDMHTKYTVQ